MAVIQVTPEVLKQKASEVRNYRSEHNDVIAKLKTLVNGLNETFKGGAHDAYVAKFESMQSTFTNFSEMLEGYAKLLDDHAVRMKEADDSGAAQINNFG